MTLNNTQDNILKYDLFSEKLYYLNKNWIYAYYKNYLFQYKLIYNIINNNRNIKNNVWE